MDAFPDPFALETSAALRKAEGADPGELLSSALHLAAPHFEQELLCWEFGWL